MKRAGLIQAVDSFLKEFICILVFVPSTLSEKGEEEGEEIDVVGVAPSVVLPYDEKKVSPP